MGEHGCIVVNILHQYRDVSLRLVLAVCGPDGDGVPRLLLKVQRGGERHAAAVTVNPKLAGRRWIQLQGVGEGGAGVHVIARHKSDLGADQHVWRREKEIKQ